jgi:hypothetical protein
MSEARRLLVTIDVTVEEVGSNVGSGDSADFVG